MAYCGQYDTLISHKRHKMIKLTLPGQKIQCVKIFTFSQNEHNKMAIYCDHFDNVRQWWRMRYSGKSLIKTIDKITPNLQTKEVNSHRLNLLKVHTQYTNFPNLESYYQRVEQNREKELKIPIKGYLYYIQQLFQLVLRGGSIPNFFYTPKNIFINRPPPLHDVQIGRLSVNFLSTIGLQLIALKENIIKEDLQQIFPLLPHNLQQLITQKNLIELNRIIQMKALAWNIVCLLIGYVPNLLIRMQFKTTVFIKQMYQLFKEGPQGAKSLMNELLQNSQLEIQAAQKQLEIDFKNLFKSILINNCNNISWNYIYQTLFLKNINARIRLQSYKRYKKEENKPKQVQTSYRIQDKGQAKINEKIIRSLWDLEGVQKQKFYTDRSIPPYSTVYFMIRTNINFRRMMNHFNILEFIEETDFCADTLKLHLTFIESAIEKSNREQEVNPDFQMPYSQKKRIQNPPFRKNQEGQYYLSINDPQLAAQRLQRKLTNGHIVRHYASQALNELNHHMFTDYIS